MTVFAAAAAAPAAPAAPAARTARVRTARVRTLRRAVALSAAALAAVGLSACGSDQPAPAGAPATTAPTAVTSAAPVSNADTPAEALAGTRYYLGTSGKEASIHAVQGDTDKVTARIPFSTGSCTENTVTVSPNGKRIAWVENGDSGGILMSSAIDGAQQQIVGKGINCLGSRALVWQGDDLLMAQAARRSLLFDLAAGHVVDGDPGEETDRCWSADGKWLAAVDESGKPFVTGGKGGRDYSYTPSKDEAAKHDGWQARSVSMDGRYVAIGWKGTDPSRQDGSFAVVDTTTSKVVELSGAGQVRSILFTADNKVIVKRAAGIIVLDADFKQVGTVEEPAAVRDLALLAYAA